MKVHASKKELPLEKDVDLGDIASMTTGFTGYAVSFYDIMGIWLQFSCNAHNSEIQKVNF